MGKVYKNRIKQWGTLFLSDTPNKAALKAAIVDLQWLFSELSAIDGKSHKEEYIQNIQSKSGIAISSNYAALCLADTWNLLDFSWRTIRFFKGFYQAIIDTKSKYPDQCIEILYAGCGPYALLASLIAPFFEPDEIQFTLLDINETSLNSAKAVIEKLDLADYVQDYVLADAVTYQVPQDRVFRVVFSETMDKALRTEPIVPIYINLLKQLPKDVAMIPENVVLEAVLHHFDSVPDIPTLYQEKQAPIGMALGQVLDMRAAIDKYINQQQQHKELIPHKISVPHLKDTHYLTIETKIQVWDNVVLNRFESSLSVPEFKAIWQAAESRSVEFVYFFKTTPYLQAFETLSKV